ncbi:peptidylprolyl isomerase [Bacillus sp. PS06]|uniref:peptidylprolyl isomerase n=1 Tax=Bacillus sp. PS06 TaxID=2764176 RepID=UPI00177D8BB7|nr:peptidylprolyl isomerase [Bacillus sp. PS06]MBD8067955.1 peptidylprolyl isomerase [Bacillus sp. PS06]
MRRNITYKLGITLLFLTLILFGCGTNTENNNTNVETPAEQPEPFEVEKHPIVTITMENDDQIQIELYPEIAPNTVMNFVSLIEQGYYDGLIFHRVIPEFMIQGGDPEGTGMGNPGYSIRGEFTANDFDNQLSHERGVISMARTQHDPNSAGSQFFIMVKDRPELDGQYAAFGKVIEGIETVDQIVEVETDEADKPLNPQIMKKVTVDTFGFDYKDPVKQ